MIAACHAKRRRCDRDVLDELADGDPIAWAKGNEQLVLMWRDEANARRMCIEILQVIAWRVRDARLIPVAADYTGDVDPLQRLGALTVIRLRDGRCVGVRGETEWPNLVAASDWFMDQPEPGKLPGVAHAVHVRNRV